MASCSYDCVSDDDNIGVLIDSHSGVSIRSSECDAANIEEAVCDDDAEWREDWN